MGLRIWVLTGDKRETAKNIGMAANIIDGDMDIMEVCFSF